MTVSSTPCSRSAPASPARRRLLAAAVLLAAGLPSRPRAAEPTLYVRAADLSLATDGWYLDAAFQLVLGDVLEDALAKGVALTFVIEFALRAERWYLWDKTVAEFEQSYRLTYNTLTRQYRVSAGALSQSVDSLAEALALLSQVRGRFVAPRDQLEARREYTAHLRMRLDTTALPKPFQLNAIASKGWTLASEWHRWAVRP
ncbi:MAG: DUF4390 domain-containing protein [Betaproteobacteria bacterium]|nr:DUF4390 domain-containing protein [Rhodocyclaceae bacterium]MCA3133906.1 DUF4390 domain-containing protein [Rhodocyclaceae bacterium]MCA3142030.1 DUF4390 domain-containing protein [Rhodocyclaceae bacterium]MCA3147198.1 DUF4390 domain-containing protein [Rhodocyclaceae bacterium]MCE2899596.1 DUF4390 domain-containing protein [Betaproteobacteria bacterium]